MSLFFFSFPFVVSVSSSFSSHLFFGLFISMSVWCLVLRPGFHFAAFFVHRSSNCDATLIAKRHFILLCVSIQHGIFAVFILSTAISVLLFIYSIQSSSSISLLSISSSVSSMKDMSLSWSQSLLRQFLRRSFCGLLLFLLHFHRFRWAGFPSCIFFLFGR